MTCVFSPTGLIPWFSKTEGNTYATLLHRPFLFKGKPTHAQEVAIICCLFYLKFFSSCAAVYGEIHAKSSKVKTCQVPITNSYPSHYIICHFPLVFLSPTSKTIFKNLCLLLAPFPFVSFCLLLVCLCVGLTIFHDDSR